MAGGRKKKPKVSSLERKRSLAAKKGWATRRKAATAAEAKKRARARKRAASERAVRIRKAYEERQRRARKGHATRRAREHVRTGLERMLNARAEGLGEADFRPLRDDFHDAKYELYEALDEDQERYLDILDEIAEEADTDWHISYGPGEE